LIKIFKKKEEEYSIKPIDVVTQEQINKMVAKKFERANEKEDYFRHFEASDPAKIYKKFKDK